MIKLLTLIFELAVLALVYWLGSRLWWHRYTGVKKGAVLVLMGCSALISVSVSMAAPKPVRIVTLTALNEKSEGSAETTVYLEKLRVDETDLDIMEPHTGHWTQSRGRYCWFGPGDARRAEGQSDSISTDRRTDP